MSSSTVVAPAPSQIEENVAFGLSRVHLPFHRNIIHIAAAEAYANLGDTEKAIYHLKQTGQRGVFYKNLIAIARSLKDSGLDTEARSAIEDAIRFKIRNYSESQKGNVFGFNGAFGELLLSYAKSADALKDKGLARKVKTHARWYVSKLSNDETDVHQEEFNSQIQSYDIQSIISAAGTIYHAGFKKHGERTLDTVFKFISSKLDICVSGDEPRWIGPGMYSALLYHQMGSREKALTLLDRTVAATETLIGDIASPIDALGYDTDDGEYANEDDVYDHEIEDFFEDVALGGENIAHENLMRLRELGMISIELDSPKHTRRIVELLLNQIGMLSDMIEDLTEQDGVRLNPSDLDIESWRTLTYHAALLLEARAFESEIRSRCSAEDQNIFLVDMMYTDIIDILGINLTQTQSPAENLEDIVGDTIPSPLIVLPPDQKSERLYGDGLNFGCEIGAMLTSAAFAFGDDTPFTGTIIDIASNFIHGAIDYLPSLGFAYEAAFNASSLDSFAAGRTTNAEHSYLNFLGEKLKELARLNPSKRETIATEQDDARIGTYTDELLDLDTNRRIISDLAGFGFTEAARNLALATEGDYRAFGTPRDSSTRLKLESVWTDFVSGALNPMIANENTPLVDARKLPNTSEHWAQILSI